MCGTVSRCWPVLMLLRSALYSVLGASLLGLCLLWAVAALPTAPLEQHTRTAVETGTFTQNYPKFLWFRPLDMYTECAGLNIALELRPDLTSLLAMRNFQECAGLRARFTENPPPSDWPYARYWHGYQVFLKPLYTWLPTALVPWVTTAMALMLFTALFFTAAQRLGKPIATALTLSFALPGSLTVFPLATHGVQLWWVLFSCIAVFLCRTATTASVPHSTPDMPTSPTASPVCASPALSPRLLTLFASIGAGAAFVCFFNMESLSLSMALLCHCLVRRHEGNTAVAIMRESLWLCAAWGVAFLGMWLIKWGLAWLVLPAGTDLFGATVSTYAARSPEMISKAILANLLRMPWTVALAAFLLLGWRFWRQSLRWPRGMSALLLPALIPFLWCALMPGHAEKHSMFMPIILWPCMAVMVMGILGEERRV